MQVANVLSIPELVDLLRTGKITDFNEKRPRSQMEFSDRQERGLAELVRSGQSFRDAIRADGESPRLLDFRKADLSGLDLTGVNFAGMDLCECNLIGANLTNANLTNSELDHVDLSGAVMIGAQVWCASFREANLQGVDLQDVIALDFANFGDAKHLSSQSQDAIINALKAGWSS